MSVLSLLVLFFFVYKQFQYERPTRWRYLWIPIYSLIMVFLTFEINSSNLLLLTIILAIGAIIGIFQARFTKFEKYQTIDGLNRTRIQGGWLYLLGWIAILLIQLIIETILIHAKMDLTEVTSEAIHTMLEDLMPFSKVGSKNIWSFWALSGASSIAYTIVSALRSSEFRQTITRGARKAERNKKSHR